MAHPHSAHIKTLAVSLSVLVLASCLCAPPVQATPSPITESGEVLRPADLSQSDRESLRKLRLDDPVIHTQSKAGYTAVWDADAWAIFESLESNKAGVSAKFSAGVFSGYFGQIQKVNNYVEWYSSDSCYSQPPNALYEHTLRSTLRQNGGPMGWLMLDVSTAVATYAPYSQALTAWHRKYCTHGYSHRFDQVVRPRVHSVDFGPFVSGTTTLSCEVA